MRDRQKLGMRARIAGLDQFRFLVWILLLSAPQACQQARSGQLVIATAANVQFAMEELTRIFEANYSIPCDIILSSSGKLTAQIQEGAPYDVFVSANMKYPKELEKSGFTALGPKVYAYGSLVLWTLREDLTPSIEQLNDPDISHIALANPMTAPYGIAAMEALKHYSQYELLEEKLVYGESIAQTNQFVLSMAADVGFTAKSVILSPFLQNKGSWTSVARDSYTPIEQGVVVLKSDAERQARAVQFYEFLFSKEAQTILQQYGYELNRGI